MSARTPSDAHLHLAFLAGGRGTRFWPLSRHDRPKQLLDVAGEGPMLRVTRDRVAALAPPRNHLVVTGADLARPCGRLLGLPARQVLAEPVARNTAAAVGLAVLVAHAADPEAVVLALPSDHHVARPDRLRSLLRRGVRAARRTGGVVLFGAVPDRPATEYGYLTLGPERAVRGAAGLRRLRSFKEKPGPAGARRLVSAGALWNSGMFCLPAEATLAAIAATVPELAAGLEQLRPHVGRRTWRAALDDVYPDLPSVSFDHGVLERLDELHALPAEVGWSDVASWEALADLLGGDRSGNRLRGDVLAHDARGCVLVQRAEARGRTLVALGLEDVVLVDDGEVVLACPRGEERDVKGLLERLRRERPELS
jgi:mannose-1-phosphate guanylyltransferase